MRNRLKDLVELASIELAYARAEIGMMKQASEEKTRVADHLSLADEDLKALMQAISELKAADKQKRTRKRVA